MNPILVDANLRKKSSNQKSAISDEPVLIDNLKPLENGGVISNVLKDLSYQQNYQPPTFLTHPSCATIIGDLGHEQVFLLQDILSDNFSSPPSSSIMSETGTSPYSDYSEDIFIDRIDTVAGDAGDEYSDIVTSTGLDIFMEDIQHVPENIYQVSGQEEDDFFHHSQASDMVKNTTVNIIGVTPAPADYTMLNNIVFEVSEKIHSDTSVTSDDTSDTSDGSGDEEEEMRTGFDIETLVEECFRQMGESGGVNTV